MKNLAVFAVLFGLPFAMGQLGGCFSFLPFDVGSDATFSELAPNTALNLKAQVGIKHQEMVIVTPSPSSRRK